MKILNQARYKDENFIVGNGTLINKNICIPLQAISAIKIEGKKKLPLMGHIITALVGVAMMLIPILSMIGIAVFLIGLISLIVTIAANYLQKYELVIQVHSGMMYILEHKDLDFIRKIADIVRKGIDDTTGVTYIKVGEEKIIQNFNGDPSFYNFGQNNNFDKIQIGGDNNTINDESNNTTSQGLTVDQWKKLEYYFRARAAEIGEANPAYQACKRMETCANQQDEKGLIRLIKMTGKTALPTIIEKASEYGVNGLFHILASLMRKG